MKLKKPKTAACFHMCKLMAWVPCLSGQNAINLYSPQIFWGVVLVCYCYGTIHTWLILWVEADLGILVPWVRHEISDDFEVSPKRVSTPIKIKPQSCGNFLFWLAGIIKRHAGNLCVMVVASPIMSRVLCWEASSLSPSDSKSDGVVPLC